LLTLLPVKVERAGGRFGLVDVIERLAGKTLRDGDVLVISSKYVAIAEGRIVRLGGVKVGREAKAMAKQFRMDGRLCELVLRESDAILGGISGFILASHDGLLTPNAGIDKSNVGHGTVVLYPRRPELSAGRIRDALRFDLGVEVAVVICDSRLMPSRRGTVGVSLASAGLEAIVDLRGKKDLFGNVLRVTSQAVADDLSSAAQLLMGESDEATPMVIVRGVDRALLRDEIYPSKKFSIPLDDDVYLRSIGFVKPDSNHIHF
jgi:coenzyme F420-0:L-glutamate ligase